MDDIYLITILGNAENYPLHDEASRVGGFVVSESQFVVCEGGMTPQQISYCIKNQFGVETRVEPFTQEMKTRFADTGLQNYMDENWP